MQIILKTSFTGAKSFVRTYTLEVDPLDSTEKLKTRIRDKTGYSPDRLQLTIDARHLQDGRFVPEQQLQNGRNLRDYGIQPGNTIFVVVLSDIDALVNAIMENNKSRLK